MQQLASVVINHVQWAFWPAAANVAAACADRLAYAPSDTLVGRSLGRMNRGQSLARALRSHRADVLVVSAGAHVYGEANFRAMLDEVAALLREAGRAAPTLIWATATGAGCSVKPLADHHEPTLQALWRELEDDRRVRTHNWPNFSTFDALARAFWPAQRAALPAGACVLDLRALALRTDARIESPRAVAYLEPGNRRRANRTREGEWLPTARADGYRDCLHFCSPGPLRLVPALLQQVLGGCAGRVP